MTLGDVANCVMAVCAVIALISGIYTFGRQKTASDVESVMSIFDRINYYWDRYTDPKSQDNEKRYSLGQILVYYENACYLANHKIISGQAFACVADHICEIWTNLNADPSARKLVESFVSSDTTFCEIKKFVGRRELIKPT